MTKIGVAGNSQSFIDEGHDSTIEAAAWCSARKIDIFEYSFGRGVHMSDDTACKIGREFKNFGIENSVHAPYFINFANPDPTAIQKSIGYVLHSVKKLKAFDNGDRVVFHPAAQGKVERSVAVAVAKSNIGLLSEAIIENGYENFKICIETMGKLGQIGTVEEVVEFCAIAPFFYPCIDFGHVNARTQGSLKTVADYENILKFMSDNMPGNKVKYMHVHFSKIMYGASGEIKHLTFADDVYGPEFEPLAEAFVKFGIEPCIVCESSGTQAEDAMTMRKIYYSVNNKA